MEALQNLDHKSVLTGSTCLQFVVTIAFFFSACVVAGFANAGFNVVITSFAYMSLVWGQFYVLNRSRKALHVGYLIGSKAVICILSLMTAIYWGQMSGCDPNFVPGKMAIDTGIEVGEHFTCEHHSSMRAVSAFASIMFVVLLGSCGLLVLWKDDFMDDVGDYADMDSGAGASSAASAYSSSPASFAPPPPPLAATASADL